MLIMIVCLAIVNLIISCSAYLMLNETCSAYTPAVAILDSIYLYTGELEAHDLKFSKDLKILSLL